jgi:hypothetical protein
MCVCVCTVYGIFSFFNHITQTRLFFFLFLLLLIQHWNKSLDFILIDWKKIFCLGKNVVERSCLLGR